MRKVRWATCIFKGGPPPALWTSSITKMTLKIIMSSYCLPLLACMVPPWSPACTIVLHGLAALKLLNSISQSLDSSNYICDRNSAFFFLLSSTMSCSSSGGLLFITFISHKSCSPSPSTSTTGHQLSGVQQHLRPSFFPSFSFTYILFHCRSPRQPGFFHRKNHRDTALIYLFSVYLRRVQTFKVVFIMVSVWVSFREAAIYWLVKSDQTPSAYTRGNHF